MDYLNNKKLQYWFIPGLLIMAAGIFYFFDPSRLSLFPRCPFQVITGYYCPGCGSQRAIHSFLHFRWDEVIHYNILMFPAAFLILYHYSRPLVRKYFNLAIPNVLYLKQTPWVILLIIVAFWILRNIQFEPFTWLSPTLF